MYRDLGYYWLRLAIYIALCLCVGTIYHDIGMSYGSIQVIRWWSRSLDATFFNISCLNLSGLDLKDHDSLIFCWWPPVIARMMAFGQVQGWEYVPFHQNQTDLTHCHPYGGAHMKWAHEWNNSPHRIASVSAKSPTSPGTNVGLFQFSGQRFDAYVCSCILDIHGNWWIPFICGGHEG